MSAFKDGRVQGAAPRTRHTKAVQGVRPVEKVTGGRRPASAESPQSGGPHHEQGDIGQAPDPDNSGLTDIRTGLDGCFPSELATCRLGKKEDAKPWAYGDLLSDLSSVFEPFVAFARRKELPGSWCWRASWRRSRSSNLHMMRRVRGRTLEPWEREARDRVEALRNALASLQNQAKAIDEGAPDQNFRGEFQRSVDLAQATAEWMGPWSKVAGRTRANNRPAFQVFTVSITTLSYCVSIFAHSLALILASPDLVERRGGQTDSDGELAGRGLGWSREVAVLALMMAEDTPALDKSHAATTRSLTSGFQPKFRATKDLDDEIRKRLDEVVALRKPDFP